MHCIFKLTMTSLFCFCHKKISWSKWPTIYCKKTMRVSLVYAPKPWHARNTLTNATHRRISTLLCYISLSSVFCDIYLDNCSKWPTSKKTMWVSLCKCVRAKILAWPLHSSLDTTSLTRIYDILLIFLLFLFSTTNTLTLSQQIDTVCQEFKCS